MVVMRNRLTIAAMVLAVVAGLGVYALRVLRVHAMHGDACLVIALEIAACTGRGEVVTDREVRSLIVHLINAGVIHGQVRADGSPADPNGNPFLIRYDERRVSVGTRRSLWQPCAVEREVPVDSNSSSLERAAGRRRSAAAVGRHLLNRTWGTQWCFCRSFPGSSSLS